MHALLQPPGTPGRVAKPNPGKLYHKRDSSVAEQAVDSSHYSGFGSGPFQVKRFFDWCSLPSTAGEVPTTAKWNCRANASSMASQSYRMFNPAQPVAGLAHDRV